jgi:acetate kinase
MKVLVLNAGSSSQKSKLYELNDNPSEAAPKALWEAYADWTHTPDNAEITISNIHGQRQQYTVHVTSRAAIIEHILSTLWSGSTQIIARPQEIDVVGHRVVHGGPDLYESTRITPEVQATIQRLASFAPLHNPDNLEGIEAAQRVLGQTPQVAVFDTAFHHHLPPEVRWYPGPYDWYNDGIRRYGFHGISHQYCMQRSASILGRAPADVRLINCHLGNGCSLAAIKDGHSVDTTMGFTPLEGLMMGGRSGTVDPGILIYLQREKGMDADQLEKLLNKESGLKGISGVSADMRQVMKAAQEGNEQAQLARALYSYRLRYFIGAMLTSLEGVDVLTFTGGVGENDAQLRSSTCAGLKFLDLALDEQKNADSPADAEISTPQSKVRVLIVHTEEDWQIAKESSTVLKKLG